MIVLAEQGDTVDGICHRHLGRTAGVVELVLDSNPGLAAHGAVLPMGTPVTLPDVAPAPAQTNIVKLWD